MLKKGMFHEHFGVNIPKIVKANLSFGYLEKKKKFNKKHDLETLMIMDVLVYNG